MVMGSTFYFFCSERGFLHKKIIKNRPASEHKNWQISFVQSKYEQHTDVFPLRSLLDIIMDTDMRAQAPRTLSDPYIHRWSRRKGASNGRVCGHVHKRIFYREDRTHKFDHCCLFKDEGSFPLPTPASCTSFCLRELKRIQRHLLVDVVKSDLRGNLLDHHFYRRHVGWTSTLNSTWNRSRGMAHKRTHTHSETYTHLPLRHWHTLVIVTDTHQHLDRVLYTYMTSYLDQTYRLSVNYW
jgi:hypothetical protein